MWLVTTLLFLILVSTPARRYYLPNALLLILAAIVWGMVALLVSVS
jgi:hypothetical protein